MSMVLLSFLKAKESEEKLKQTKNKQQWLITDKP